MREIFKNAKLNAVDNAFSIGIALCKYSHDKESVCIIGNFI